MRTSWWKFSPSLKLIRPSVAYSVIAADTLRDLVSLTFWPCSVVIHDGSCGQPLHQVWRSYGYTFLSYDLWVLTFPIGYHWKCVCSHCACAVSRDLCVGGKFFPHIWNPWPPFAYWLYNFYGATIKTNGVISQNSPWPCAKDHTTFCACAKSSQRSTLP